MERLWVAARLATAQQPSLHAATLFGLADQTNSQIHGAWGAHDGSFAEVFATGQRMTLEEAFAGILVPGRK